MELDWSEVQRRTNIGWELQFQMQALRSISRKYESRTIENGDDTDVYAWKVGRDNQGMYLSSINIVG